MSTFRTTCLAIIYYYVLMPVKGISLPFLTYGGISLFSNMMYIDNALLQEANLLGYKIILWSYHLSSGY